jgi:hypothetical protein
MRLRRRADDELGIVVAHTELETEEVEKTARIFVATDWRLVIVWVMSRETPTKTTPSAVRGANTSLSSGVSVGTPLAVRRSPLG